ncbi:MAG TPA: translation initiation factor IF-2 [Candidatus Omnitrophota bacterium]|nr:translation initiation factor IF-2 [Candidatus Omnitrophota bacterium]
MSVRVHELAKELKLTSKELIDKLKTLKVDAKSHMSVLTDDNVKALKELVSGKAKAAAPKAAEPKTAAKTAPQSKTETPAAKTGVATQMGSLESVKNAFMIQRQAAKPAPSPEIKRPKAPEAQSAPSPIRRAPAPPLPPKPKAPVADIKKPVKPFPTIETPAPAPVQAQTAAKPAAPAGPRKLEVETPIIVKDLAVKLFSTPSDLIQRLIKIGIFANINQSLNFEVASKVALELGFELAQPVKLEAEVRKNEPAKDMTKQLKRAPIVTFMGHVDHGKTSLLDAIRNTKVAAGEAGGITQHIGAYEVFLPEGAVTFLDTPGHEAFTQMRARGAKATDVVVLVVAADDGVMPQTVEAIDHAKAAGVPIVVAINKMDLPSANPDRVKKNLMEHGIMTEEWGGKVVTVGVSAKTGKGIDELLELLSLESDLLELKADPSAMATGVVLEGELSKESGVLATLLVQDGTLRVGDAVVVGGFYCRVRAMINDRGQRIKEALPSMPVRILGLSGVPKAGDRFYVVKDERTAKEIVDKENESLKLKGPSSHITLEHLFEEVKAGKVSELKLIIKSDVQGSVEALRSTLAKIPSKNVKLNIIHTGIGDVTESDVMLAAASDAVVIGFHVGISESASATADKEQVDVRFYQIIYEVHNAIQKAMEGLLEPELKEVFVGAAEVRQVFKVSKVGMIAGCSVQKGKIVRNYQCRVIRGGQKIHEGKVESLKRFKDDAREVLEGFECGIGVSNFEELTLGDRIEVYEIQKKTRKLE